ncbi:hypothetical protein PG1C_07030 [Rugosibacter aromaticivorans]|uniref:Primase C-terminal 2 domain-containing protein n=1 Tax=Rugosibacter aromaticivorans TaxID=1565605 RepID=A0A0C5J9C7_9PROT|nr:PriCT-2 domain-containing protein [Rugosibacter aromaticivorans]AJP48284.1 hypothetical protein PG1C_07030 [Rugosibacter aromaticivorans]TAJ17282.1 MAG: hypothetical protein EPO60_10055 [Rugosibacter sp.]TBR15102.1 MAG: hypothetical protein EPO43_05080 [Rugosibacter sp.]
MKNPNTLPARCLALMLNGQSFTHPEFEQITGSWRLSAVVFTLKGLGWPVESFDLSAPSPECATRTISRYYLPVKAIQAHNWSASASNYAGENDCRTVWKSFDDSGAVTPATLYGMAFAQSWKDLRKSRTKGLNLLLPSIRQALQSPLNKPWEHPLLICRLAVCLRQATILTSSPSAGNQTGCEKSALVIRRPLPDYPFRVVWWFRVMRPMDRSRDALEEMRWLRDYLRGCNEVTD